MTVQSVRSVPTIVHRGKFNEVKAGLFSDKPLRSVLLLPVNAYIKNDGRAVMAKGCALVARERFRGIDLNWGMELELQGRKRGNYGMLKTEARGNYPAIIWNKRDVTVVAFPTQWHFIEQADLSLIERSLGVIVTMADYFKWSNVYLPEIGCGAGRRNYREEIKPLLMDYLDDRFTVCHLTNEEFW